MAVSSVNRTLIFIFLGFSFGGLPIFGPIASPHFLYAQIILLRAQKVKRFFKKLYKIFRL
nr:MAG TPA: hypothetical protein [Bacteriophage sp.]